MLTFNELKQRNELLLLKCISGSNAYGLQLPTSDVDYKGVFALPRKLFFSLDTLEQLSNSTSDEVYYEIKRFIDLLYKNNPNILELLATPADCILYKHALMDRVKPELFLSKLCKETFAGYALTQIKKAKGLNKKIVNPVDKELKTLLNFCHVINWQQSIALSAWLTANNFKQEECGLVAIAHMRDTYLLFHQSQLDNGSYFRGIIAKETANDVALSSVPKDIEPLTVLNFNKDGYSKYCKDYKEYWEWVDRRNDERYNNTLQHGKNYDAKNMMHVFRLLNMAEEIATEKKVMVRRPDREHLLQIRRGEFLYEDLVKQADEKLEHIQEVYKTCDLPDAPDKGKVNDLLFELMGALYSK